MELDAITHIKKAIHETAVTFGHSKPVADDLAQAAAHKIMKSIGGAAYYIAKHESVIERNSKIKQEFNGKNRAEILKKYAINKSTFYRIIGKRGE
jgi:Mor family transcriptional regulator